MTTRRPRRRSTLRAALSASVTIPLAAALAAAPHLMPSAHAAVSPAISAAPMPATVGVEAADAPADRMPTGRVIVRFKDGSAAAVSTAARDRALDAVGAGTDVDLEAERRLGTGATLVAGADPAQAQEVADRLQARPDVAYAEPDVRLTIARTATPAPNDPLWHYQWNLAATDVGIDAPAAWPRTRGAGVTVAVVDTGIVRHPDLSGQVLPGYDFISDPRTARDGNGRDNDPTDLGDWLVNNDCGGTEKAADSTWHGTHVAGAIAALSGNGAGIAGVAPRAKILPVRAIGRCGGSLADIADGITWATGGTVQQVPKNANVARVVNLSLGGPMACPATLQAAIDGALARRAVVVTAAGNSGIPAERESPGNCRGVINVAATTGSGARANYSNYGRAITLAAPGGQTDRDGILSTIDGGRRGSSGPEYGFMVGTSMAAPHVSGVAALLLSASPGLTPAQVSSVLTSSARPFTAACNGCGAGIVDAGRAVAAVLGSPAKANRDATAATGGQQTVATGVARTSTHAPVVDQTLIPNTVHTTPRARLAWEPFAGASGDVRYTVQWRPITLDGATRRYGAWSPVATDTTARSMWAGGMAGGVYQYRVRGTDSAGVTSAWSQAATVTIPADLTARVGRWRGSWSTVRDASAVSGTLMRTSERGAGVTLPSTYAAGVAVVAGTGPGGGVFDIVVNGKRVQRVDTKAARTSAARNVATVRLPYGRADVQLVRVSGTISLDAIAYLR
ncbi:subtilisin family serine protease [Kineosphaera limosa]|uniref:Putative peptidase S8 family protein n=1 Tax=Kineosphaera limosa NBRC 100340 TaxID=1184609 RepID=K6WNX9_9MICO|nr:S8 family serine peptidase [Kineosphaera limosa]NYD99937.1 subtilisin family serine protease [Kineosphaera limosa]GAB95526.1 putative peptidase S8 family protein [Kineosphaera limosa NBRC 100340]